MRTLALLAIAIFLATATAASSAGAGADAMPLEELREIDRRRDVEYIERCHAWFKVAAPQPIEVPRLSTDPKQSEVTRKKRIEDANRTADHALQMLRQIEKGDWRGDPEKLAKSLRAYFHPETAEKWRAYVELRSGQ
jgi:hypothetical protein